MVIDTIATLDTYFYAGLVLVAWNFIWTRKLSNKVYGDGKDPTENGLAVEVDSLKQRVRELENKQE
jgi:hypothetical protein